MLNQQHLRPARRSHKSTFSQATQAPGHGEHGASAPCVIGNGASTDEHTTAPPRRSQGHCERCHPLCSQSLRHSAHPCTLALLLKNPVRQSLEPLPNLVRAHSCSHATLRDCGVFVTACPNHGQAGRGNDLATADCKSLPIEKLNAFCSHGRDVACRMHFSNALKGTSHTDGTEARQELPAARRGFLSKEFIKRKRKPNDLPRGCCSLPRTFEGACSVQMTSVERGAKASALLNQTIACTQSSGCGRTERNAEHRRFKAITGEHSGDQRPFDSFK